MKKLYVSVPMKGRTAAAIINSIDKMHQIAEIIFGEKLEIVNPYPEIGPDVNDSDIKSWPVYYLGNQIKRLAKADYIIGVSYEPYFKGCCVERDIANDYNIPGYYLNLQQCEFLKDAFEVSDKVFYAPVKGISVDVEEEREDD